MVHCLMLAAITLAAACRPGPADSTTELRVAAASDLKFAMDELVREFHASHPGRRVSVTYGSSGNFVAQLEHGAPFDLYFSADIDYPRRLRDKGQALDDDVFMYAIGRLVVWGRMDSPVDVGRLGIDALRDPAVKKIAVANPDHAPYGRAAMAAIRHAGLEEAVAGKLVRAENIAQAAQFVQSGAADLGLLALALVVAPQMRAEGRWWEVPLDAYPTMEQGGMIMKSTRAPDAARAFRDHVRGEHGRQVLTRFGYFLPADP